MEMPLNRIPPSMEPGAYKTYRITAPASSHWTSATCEEIDCEAYLNGWKTIVDETTDLGQRQAYYMRHDNSRSHTENKRPDGLTEFVYSAGHRCFSASTHKKRIQRPDLFRVQGGDYRGNPMGIPTVTHTKAEYWAEDFAEHQNKLAKLIDGS